MPIKTQSADGIVHEFPDDTPPEAVDRAMKSYAQEHANKTSTLGQVGTGMMDPIEGGAQLLAKMMPAPIERGINAANNWLADKTGLVAKLPPGGMDQAAQQREAENQQQRGVDAGKFDFPRVIGNILSPANYVGAGLIGGAGRAANLARATAGGAGAGLLEPVLGDNYGVEKTGQVALGTLWGFGTGVAFTAASKGVDKIGEYLTRNHPEALENRAVQKILHRMGQDTSSGSPTAVDLLHVMNASSKPLTLADVGGANVKGLAGNVARKPGEARNLAVQFLSKRDEGAAQRLSQDIAQHIHGGETAFQATEALLHARSAASRAPYDEFHDLQGIWSPRLQEFFAEPNIKVGLGRGYELERMRSLAEGRPLSVTQLGVDLDVNGDIKLVKNAPNTRLLDMAKRGLDAMIADERNEITGRLSARGVALDMLRRAYIGEIDALDRGGVYRRARDTWAGPSASMDSIKLGRSAFGMNPEESAAEVARLSPRNREFYKLGVADVVKERLQKAGFDSNEARSIIRNPWMRDQLRPAFNSTTEFDNFVSVVSDESRMFKTKQGVLGGSQTAERLEESGTDNVENALRGGHAVGQLLLGHPIRAAIDAWRFYRDVGLKPDPKLNEAVAKILFKTPLDSKSSIAGKLTGTVPSQSVNPLERTARGISGAGALAGPASATMQPPNRPAEMGFPQ